MHYRGGLLVHAAKRIENDLPLELREIVEGQFGCNWHNCLPRGALIGAVTVTECWPTGGVFGRPAHDDDFTCGDWSHGRYAYRRADTVHVFRLPIPWRGQQAVPFDVPDGAIPGEEDAKP